MGWAFWRRDRPAEQARPLPDGVGLDLGRGDRPGPAAAHDPDRERDDGADAPAAPPAGSRPVPSTAVPDLPGGPVPLTAPLGGPVAGDPAAGDTGFRDACRDGVAAVVAAVVHGEPAAARATIDALRGHLATATTAQEGQAVVVSLAALSARLPELSGVTGSVHDDPHALSLLLAYADLLAERAEPLRVRTAPAVPREQLRFAARSACGAPYADPALAPLMASPTGDQVVAACLLLAQTCLDGGGPAQTVAAETDAVLGG